eukprot:CAMPEP_0172081048 /NCGR_PEP_ID=MMETSP1043-20130122/19089_1 /TAXON_ID=464988 /ORGANISM="Hemiselmis andersenii, Strain CCMP441" /LENGTH=68 /DNA_ID=CAMNT_0012742453 /DNA_START=21 /DNA_END=224 /DNA_ORIENTATION=+
MTSGGGGETARRRGHGTALRGDWGLTNHMALSSATVRHLGVIGVWSGSRWLGFGRARLMGSRTGGGFE